MTLPRLDIVTWEMADGRLAGEIADAGQVGPFEEFVLRSLLVNRPAWYSGVRPLPSRTNTADRSGR